MMYIVAYDLADDRTRERVATVLGGFGVRVQESVFECRLAPVDLERLRVALVREFQNPDLGSIRLYRLCEECVRASSRIGVRAATDDDEVCVVL